MSPPSPTLTPTDPRSREGADAGERTSAVPEPPPAGDQWHALDSDRVLALQTTSPDGLDAVVAARRLTEHGPNVIPRGETEGPLQILLRQINTPLIYVLIGSGLLAMVMGKA